ncbi:MAG: alpha/beta hydrolase [Bryobacter sp.]|nr:alpha/beta hydrolase [Bryobacter sp.]
MPDLKIGYRTYGTLNADKSNVILFPTWFNGKSGDLPPYIEGPKAFVDTSKYYVVAIDAIGNGVSMPPKGKEFPNITIGDMVRSQHEVLTKKLGITKLHAVVGISMGAMQGFEWIARYPEMAPRLVSIVGTPQMTAKDAMLWTNFLRKKPDNNPDAPDQPEKKKSSMWESIASVVLSRVGNGGGGGGGIPMPMNVLRQFNAMVRHNATQHFSNSLERMTKELNIPVLVILADKDEAVSNDLPAEYVKLAGGKAVRVDIPGGHNAYKTNQQAIREASLRFLEGKGSVYLEPSTENPGSIFAPPY